MSGHAASAPPRVASSRSSGSRHKGSRRGSRSQRTSKTDSEVDVRVLEESTGLEKELLLRKLFRKFDEDHSGTIDQEEFTKVLKHMGIQANADAVKSILFTIDIDGDGTVDEEEFVEFFDKVEELADMKLMLEASARKEGIWQVIVGIGMLGAFVGFCIVTTMFVKQKAGVGDVMFWVMIAAGAVLAWTIMSNVVMPLLQMKLQAMKLPAVREDPLFGDADMPPAKTSQQVLEPEAWAAQKPSVDFDPPPMPTMPRMITAPPPTSPPGGSSYRNAARQLYEMRTSTVGYDEEDAGDFDMSSPTASSPSHAVQGLRPIAAMGEPRPYAPEQYAEVAASMARMGSAVQFNPVTSSRCQMHPDTMRIFNRGTHVIGRTGARAPVYADLESGSVLAIQNTAGTGQLSLGDIPRSDGLRVSTVQHAQY
mmetsp:Transcript_101403/g.232423  ORF Transcript_101403/g.232423 Transcript_101403/m.232423 type:complete len:423 (-) Transcript_101403:43-1311(-)